MIALRSVARTGILKNVRILLASILALSGLLAGQQLPTYTIKSWKTGNAQAQPQTLEIALSKAEPEYHKVINDVSRNPLYDLQVKPAAFIGPGDGIVAWHVYLTAPNSQGNLLIPSDSLEQEEYREPDYLWWFYPGNNPLVPMGATRVVRVAGSYVTLKAADVKVNGSGQLEGMKLTVSFSNNPPASAD